MTATLDQTAPRTQSQAPVPWLWSGALARGGVTLLSATEKCGKTTLIRLLLDRRRAGRPLLGAAVMPGRSIVCTEEDASLWSCRCPPLDFGPGVEFCQIMESIPTRANWHAFIEFLESREPGSFDLLVIDTVHRFMPASYRNLSSLQWALHGLRVLTERNVAVLLVNPVNALTRPLAAFADIVVDLKLAPGDRLTRRRIFECVGRYPGTLGRVIADLNAEGTDYVVAPTPPPLLESERAGQPGNSPLDIACLLLAESETPLMGADILSRWPTSVPRPTRETLWRALSRGVELGVLVCQGAGKKGDGFRYALAVKR